MRTSTVFAPGHLTGLFQICDQSPDPLRKGARGSGISLERGTTTKVTLMPALEKDYSIFINDQLVNNAVVSDYVINYYLNIVEKPCTLRVEHAVETPITAGFGSSGGGALSLSLALNHLLGTGYSRLEAAQVAHLAEIGCKTGLGSVYAADAGGFGVLTKPGAPGVGESFSYKSSGKYRVIYVYYGPIHTREALSNPDLRRKINEVGGGFIEKLVEEFSPERFIRFSRLFTEHIGLVTPRLRRLFDRMDSEGFTFTMAMFGEVAFTVLPANEVDEVLTRLIEIEDVTPSVCRIDEDGARFL